MKKTEKSNTNEIIEIPAEEAPYALPDGWKWVKLNKVSKIKRGASPRPINQYLTDSKEGINWIKIGDTGDGKYVEQVKERITQEGKNKSVFVEKGALLLSNSMSFGRPYILKVDGCIHDGWLSITPFELVDKEFLYYALLASRWYFEQVAVGTAVRNLNSERVAGTPIPLPPFETQKRIVDRIESLFAKLDEAKEKAQTALDTFELRKSAILHKAFTGELTAKWRSSCRPSDISSAPAHIESAPADISSSAPAEHIDNDASITAEHFVNISSVTNSLFSNTKQSTAATVEQALPNSWRRINLQNVCATKITDGTHKTPTYCEANEGGIPFISSKDVTTGKICWDNIKYITPELHSELYARLAPQKDDVLLAKNGTTGVAALVDTDKIFDLYVTLAVLRPNKRIVLPKYLLSIVNSPICKRQFDEHLTGIGVPNLHLRDIKEVVIPVPPLSEQQEIVRILDDLLAKENAAKEAAEAVIEKIDLMKKSILARAFRGEL